MQFYLFPAFKPWILCIKYSGNPVNRGKFHLEHLNQFFPVETVYKLCRNSVETVSTKTNTNSLWKLTQPFSSHNVIPLSLHTVIIHTKDCGEKFQKVQKLIKKFSHQFLFSTQVDRKRPIHHHRDLTGISGPYYADA